MTAPHILHVSNRWGGGVKTVVQQYIASLPEYRHSLLHTSDPWTVQGCDEERFESLTHLPPKLIDARRSLQSTIRDLGVDIVHGHSSYAGALLRLMPNRCRTVYTPHAFATLAPRGSHAWFAGQSERLLGRRPVTFAAVSESEARLARRYSPGSNVIRILNLPASNLHSEATFQRPSRVVMCGRICAQKDPRFFAETADLVRRAGSSARFEWVGDGERCGRRVLEAAGVSVTGWLEQDEAQRRIAQATVYLHSARYEGACLSVLDAAALGIPSVGRPVPGVEEAPWLELASTPAMAAQRVLALDDEHLWESLRDQTLAAVSELTAAQQRAQLLAAYAS